MSKKTLVICNFPRFNSEIWLPVLWAQAKTYYELYGNQVDNWEWYPSYLDCYDSTQIEKIKQELLQIKPDIFAISLYVWNYQLAHTIAEWVKTTWPHCIIVTGGPHQYLKHDIDWFKKHWYIDASHPGDCYGELMFKELLDTYDNGLVDWTQITDIRYPSKSRAMLSSLKTMSREDKKKYQYDWSAFTKQFSNLKEFETYKKINFPDSMLLSIIETTRGCPYGCTYCDWGGGIATTVIQKSLDAVKQDIDSLCKINLTYLYFADANLGIFGDRDVDIILYLIKRKQELGLTFKVGYGGFAKTENRLESIQKIVNLDLTNNLSNSKELKISLQTLDSEILDNIDRKNISLDKQLELFNPLAKKNKIPMYVEIIMGLPGMTLDKFYYELNVFGKNKLAVEWYEWILLPEAPSYDLNYRKKWGIQTVYKTNGWSFVGSNSDHEIVIGSSSYSSDEYLEMLLASGLYNLFIQGGYAKNTLSWIEGYYKIGVGDIIRNYLVIQDDIVDQWIDILSSDNVCQFDVAGEKIYGGFYYIAQAFLNPDSFNLMSWLKSSYNVSDKIIKSDIDVHLNINNLNTKIWKRVHTINFDVNRSFTINDIHGIISLFKLFMDTGKIMRGQKKFLNLLTINK